MHHQSPQAPFVLLNGGREPEAAIVLEVEFGVRVQMDAERNIHMEVGSNDPTMDPGFMAYVIGVLAERLQDQAEAFKANWQTPRLEVVKASAEGLTV